jgi:hypothetical protein
MTDGTNETTALAVVEGGASDEKPKTLRAYEKIVETNAAAGAAKWRLAADALLAIRTHKLWKKAKDADGNGYKSFVDYAEARFGFKKTYAYDLVKAATRKPEAITEGAARAELREARGQSALNAYEAAQRINRAFARFEDAAGNLRDRAIDDEAFVETYDRMVARLQEIVNDFVGSYPMPVAEEAEAETEPVVEKETAKARNAKVVSPKRES